MRITTLYLIIFPWTILCRDAIQYFVKHKKVKELVIHELKNKDNSSGRWFEYKYVFDNTKDGWQAINTSLKVGVFINDYLKFDQVDCRISEKSNETLVEGYNIDIIKNLEPLLNISAEITIVDDLAALEENRVDIVICRPHLEVLPSRIVELHPVIRSNLVLVFKPKQINFVKDIFILTFTGSLWVVFFAILSVLAICLRLSTRVYAQIKPKYEPWTWVETTLWAIAAACQQGLSHTPSGFVSCTIFLLGYLMSYLLYTGFTAAITSILVENVGTNVNLNNVRTETLHLTSLKYLSPYIRELQSRFLVTEFVDDLEELFQHLEEDNKIGIAPEVNVRQYMANNFHSNRLSLYQTMMLNITYNTGFLILQTNPWRKLIDKGILILDESGILQNMLKRNLKLSSTLDSDSIYSSAGQEHVGSANILFLGGVTIAIVFFISEFILYLYKTGQKIKNNTK